MLFLSSGGKLVNSITEISAIPIDILSYQKFMYSAGVIL